MEEYLHLFNSESAFTKAYKGSSYMEPWVSATNTGGGWQPTHIE